MYFYFSMLRFVVSSPSKKITLGVPVALWQCGCLHWWPCTAQSAPVKHIPNILRKIDWKDQMKNYFKHELILSVIYLLTRVRDLQ